MTQKTNIVPRVNPDQLASKIEGYWHIIVDWIVANEVGLMAAAVAGITIFMLLTWLKRWAVVWSLGAPDRTSIRAILARAASRTSRYFRAMLSIELVNIFANSPPFIDHAITFLFTISFVWQIAIWAREIIIGLIERRAEASDTEHETLKNAMTLIRLLVSFAVFAVATIVTLDNLGVNVTGLVAGLGVGGIAIGLAAQGIFSDLFAAISIIFDQPFKRGDTISYDTTTARVEKVGMKSTRLRALTGEEKIISNSKLLEKEITNATATDHRRTQYILPVTLQTPHATLQKLPDMLKQIVEDEKLLFIRAGISAFSPSSFDIQLVFDVAGDDLDQLFDARHRVALGIIKLFTQQKIEFAYPTQTTFTAAPDGTLVMPYAAGPLHQPKQK